MHPDFDSIRAAARQREILFGHGVPFQVLNSIKPLQQPHGHIARLGQGELLA